MKIILLLFVFAIVSCNKTSELSNVSNLGGQPSSADSSLACSPGAVQLYSCASSIPNSLVAEQELICNGQGNAYEDLGCVAKTCLAGFALENNQCVLAQSCTPNSSEQISCVSEIPNSTVAFKYKNCNAEGSGFDLTSCQVTVCQAGYVINKNLCVLDNGTPSDNGPKNVRRWSTVSLPLTIAISSELTSNDADAVLAATNEWDFHASDFNIFEESTPVVTDNKQSGFNDYKDSVYGVYLVKPGDPFSYFDTRPQTIAVAAHYYQVSNGYEKITSGDIFVNMKSHSFGHNGESNKIDFETVLLHELGHLVGLGHSQVNPSVMAPSVGLGVVKRQLFQADMDKIHEHYHIPAQAKLAKANTQNSNEGEETLVVMELTLDGKCRHYENDKLVDEHSVALNKK